MLALRGSVVLLLLLALTAGCGPAAATDVADAGALSGDASGDAVGAATPVLGLATGATFVTAESGGLLHLPGSQGRQLTLAFAPHALAVDTTVTCQELTALTGAPLASFLGGVQCAPNGLSLALPATLTVQTADALPTAALVGVTVQDDGSDLHWTLAQRLDPHTATVALTHFTGWGLGAANPGQQPPAGAQPWTQASAEQALTTLQVIAQQTGTPASLPALAQILQGWFDTDLSPRLVARDAAVAEATFAEAVAWQLDVSQNGVDGVLAVTVATERKQLAAFLAAVVQDHLNTCNANNDLQEAQLATTWFARIQALGLEVESGIDINAFRTNFCVHVQITAGDFGPISVDGSTGTFDATFTYTIGSAAPSSNRPFRVRTATSSGTITPPTTVTSVGQGYHGDTAPMPAGSDMTVQIQACVLPFDAIACADQGFTDTQTAPCGHAGISCCGGGACAGGTTCQAGVCQLVCGDLTQACCSGGTCNAGMCVGGTCQNCGATGQACCPGQLCTSFDSCQGNFCLPCGSQGAACCPGNTCNGGTQPQFGPFPGPPGGNQWVYGCSCIACGGTNQPPCCSDYGVTGSFVVQDAGTFDGNNPNYFMNTCDQGLCDGSGKVLDVKSGIAWSRFPVCPPHPGAICGVTTWKDAQAACVAVGGSLPSTAQYQSLLEDAMPSCAFPTGLPKPGYFSDAPGSGGTFQPVVCVK